MKAAIFLGPRKIEVQDVPDSTIENPDDAIVKVTHTCICGSDLWWYRGLLERDVGPIGHEFMGIVEAIGEGVKNVKPGDLVVAPFLISDGTCPECQVGITSSCRNVQRWGTEGNDAGQGEKVRVPLADGTLFVIPQNEKIEKLMPALLPLSDVLCTGHHAAVCAKVEKGSTVLVIGDGAVGLCAVAASKRLGASRIFLGSTHPDRAEVGTKFGATDVIEARGEEAVQQVKAMTDNLGVDCVLECVGTAESWETAFGAVRDGGNIGAVGLPYEIPDIPISKIFWRNVGIKGGPAPAAHYIPELMSDVISGKLNVSAVFTMTVSLSDIAKGYEAMDQRRAIKVLVKP
jgi:threonine dehydrogenase-like Zn-dependent dehydrogenase